MKSPLDNPAFRRWFGDSEVVDRHGQPLVVYHGAPGGGFTVFRGGYGIYFTDKWDVAISYIEDFDEDFGLGAHSSDPTTPLGAPENYEDGIYAVYLRIENPLYVDAAGADFNEINLSDTGFGYFEGETGSISDLVMDAEREGYDGLIVENVFDMGPHYRSGPEVKSTIYVVFDPRQIKSASVQRGTYDPEDPDIRHNPRRRRNGASALTLDNLAGPITLGEGRCRVHFDNTDGSGAVPDLKNIEYMGAVVLMRPSVFLRLVPPLLQPSKRTLEHLAQTRSTTGWAYPFLSIDLEEPRVRQHEGRHRCTLLVEAGCDEPIPVALFLSGMRARHIEPEDIEFLRRGMVGQHRTFVPGPLFREALWAGQERS